MGDTLVRLCTLACVGLVPLAFSVMVEDVFFSAWRAAQAILLALVLAVIGRRLWTGRLPLRIDAAGLPWLLFGAWALAAVSWSVNPWDSLRRAIELSGAVAAFWLGRAAAPHWPRLRGAALLAAGLCTVYGILQVLGLDPMPWSVKFGRASGTLGNPDYYAGHLLLVLPLLASVAAAGGAGRAELLLGPLLAAGFLLSHVRGAWLASAAAAGWGAFWVWRGGALAPSERALFRRAAWIAGALALVLLAASPAFRGRLGSIFSVGGYDATGRRYLWTVAFRIASERPFTGWGTGTFKFQFPRHQIEGAEFHLPQFKPYNYSEHAHSELLQFAAELGAVGVALFVWGLLAWLVPWMRGMAALRDAGRRREWWTQWSIGTAVAGAFIYGWVNFPFQIVPTALLFWILLGVSSGRLGGAPGRELPHPVAAATGALGAALGLVAAWLTACDLVGGGYLRVVRSELEADRPPSAYYVALRAERMLPHDYRVYRWMARIAIRKNDTELADRMLAMRRRLHPYLADALLDRADFDRHNGRTDEALARYTALLEEAPNFVQAWGQIGAIRFERSEYVGAVEAFKRAIDLHDADPVWHHNLAAAYGIMKMYREALYEDEAAVARDPSFADAWVGVALSARKVGQLGRAREAAARAYALAPQDPRAASLYSQLHQR